MTETVERAVATAARLSIHQQQRVDVVLCLDVVLRLDIVLRLDAPLPETFAPAAPPDFKLELNSFAGK